MHVELSAERYAELRVRPGDSLYVSPRKVRVFVPDGAEVPDYVI
jgi:hypothetical protein